MSNSLLRQYFGPNSQLQWGYFMCLCLKVVWNSFLKTLSMPRTLLASTELAWSCCTRLAPCLWHGGMGSVHCTMIILCLPGFTVGHGKQSLSWNSPEVTFVSMKNNQATTQARIWGMLRRFKGILIVSILLLVWQLANLTIRPFLLKTVLK